MRTRRTALSRWAGALLLAIVTGGLGGAAFAQDELHVYDAVRKQGRPERVPDEFIVKFKAGVSELAVHQINAEHGTHVLSTSRRVAKFKRLRVPRGKRAEELVDAYRRNPSVEYAEPNYLASTLFTPNDPYYKYQWHLDNLGTGGIRMQSAWDVNAGGSASVVVAIVDTGVAYEDFGTTFKQAPDLAQTTFVPGYDFVANDAHPNDENSHGTHVTGTVAQSTNNGLGTAGVAFKTAIMPVRVLDKNGSGTYTNIADGIYFATDHGAQVISMSLGGPASVTMENAVKYAYDHGVTVVAASGNDGPTGTPSYPAAYDAYVIAVAATRYDEAVSPYSTRGSYVDVAAPGGDTSVDQNGDGYGDGVLQQTFNPNTKNPSDFGYWFFQGTSMATPHVSGVAALLIAKGLTGPDTVRAAIEKTARDRGPAGRDTSYGWGLIDAYAALNYAPSLHDVSVTQVVAPSTILQGNNAAVSVNVSDLGTFSESFTVTVTDITSGVVIGSQGVSLSAGAAQSVPFTWNTAGVSPGSHTLAGQASIVTGETNTSNNSASTTSTVQSPVHDVAVTGLDVLASVTVGNLVNVQVTVANTGTFAESTTVTLRDETAGVTIGSQETSLSVGASTVVSFNWATTGAALGGHILKATASAVTGETSLGDNQLATTVSVQQQSLAFQESSGQVVMEAEHYDGKIPRQSHDWLLETSLTGYAGTGYLQVLPNTGATINTGYTTTSPELVFNVTFTTTGTYYVWIRGSADSGSDDSCHAGLDGVGPASADRMSGFTSSWVWKRTTMDNSAPATLVITTPGRHTIHLWMREDGLRVDKLLLRKSSSSTAPSGNGPAESPRVFP